MARGVAGKLALLVLLVVVASGAWMFRGLIPGPWQRDPVISEVSEEGAIAAEAKLERLRNEGDTVRMSGIEFTSYMRYRMAQRFAADIEMPTVAFAGDQVRVAGRLPKDRIPESQLRQLGRAALKVTSVAVERLPIPRDRYLSVLDRVGGMDEPGLERDEVAFQLPPGVGAAHVENGELVLAPGKGR